MMQVTQVGQWMSHGVSGAEVFLERNAAHQGGQLHPPTGFDLSAVIDRGHQVFGNEMDAFQSNAVAEWLQDR